MNRLSNQEYAGQAKIPGLILAVLSCLLLVPLHPAAHAESFASAAVATDHPLASEMGADILRRGGNAADAAVATGLALGVLNPFASGLGGGGFLVYHDRETGETVALDFRESAPAAASRDMFVLADGSVDHERFRHGGAAVAVPAELHGWWALHERYGQLAWSEVVEPVIALARDGFTVGTLLPERLAGFADDSERWPELRAAFVRPDGEFVEAGDTVVRSELAALLALIAERGPDAFYEGASAQAIVDSVQSSGGVMTLEDLSGYEVRWSQPVIAEYAGHTIVGMGLPSSGGTVIGMILGALRSFHIERVRPLSPAWIHVVTEMMIHAFADRGNSMGDVTTREAVIAEAHFLSDERIQRMVDAYRPTHTLHSSAYGPLIGTNDDDGTSHFSIVDVTGDAVSVTSTINTSFGSYVYVPEIGLVLNNEMNDFSAQPGVPNAFGLVGSEANAIGPGKRPLSSMSPTLVLRDGVVVGALGGSGGPKIISGTLLTLLHLIHGAESTHAAIEQPRFHHQWVPAELEVDADLDGATRNALSEYGYEVVPARWSASVQAIWKRGGVWDAASDSAKHGAPAGY